MMPLFFFIFLSLLLLLFLLLFSSLLLLLLLLLCFFISVAMNIGDVQLAGWGPFRDSHGNVPRTGCKQDSVVRRCAETFNSFLGLQDYSRTSQFMASPGCTLFFRVVLFFLEQCCGFGANVHWFFAVVQVGAETVALKGELVCRDVESCKWQPLPRYLDVMDYFKKWDGFTGAQAEELENLFNRQPSCTRHQLGS